MKEMFWPGWHRAQGKKKLTTGEWEKREKEAIKEGEPFSRTWHGKVRI